MIEPSTIGISKHCIDRYVERRGWCRSRAADAESAIRAQLARVAHQHPHLFVGNGHQPSRRYCSGQLTWIVSGDYQTVITFYARAEAKRSKRGRRLAA